MPTPRPTPNLTPSLVVESDVDAAEVPVAAAVEDVDVVMDTVEVADVVDEESVDVCKNGNH